MAEYSGCQDMRDLLTLYLHAGRKLGITENLRHNIIHMGENIMNMMRDCACSETATVEQLKAHVEVCPQCQLWIESLMHT